MNCVKLSKNCGWIEGHSKAKDLIFDLTKGIENTNITTPIGGKVNNPWKIVFSEGVKQWVTYDINFQNTTAYYKDANGNSVRVVRLNDYTNDARKDSEGFIWELRGDTPYTGYDTSYRTGRKVNVEGFSHEGTYYSIPNALAVLIDEYPNQHENTFPNRWDKYRAYLVKHVRENYLGDKIEDTNWNRFEIVAPLPDDWTYFLYHGNGNVLIHRYRVFQDGEYHNNNIYFNIANYSFSEARFTAKYNTIPSISILNYTEIVNGEEISYNVLFEKPLTSNSYIDISYGFDITEFEESIGDDELTYKYACDKNSIGYGKNPVIINTEEAYKAYERQIYEHDNFKPRRFNIKDDFISPPSHFFFNRNFTENWVVEKNRSENEVVNYWVSVGESRLVIVLEGDPSLGHDEYYRSMAYIGKTESLIDGGEQGNFAVTVGMGDLVESMTGFRYSDINKKHNPVYAKYGKYTSNGMDTISMFRGVTGAYFQEYYPSFLTQLPNYPNVGSIPNELKRLVLEKHGFQVSLWTDHVHSSPIYLVHPYEGYRCNLEGIVAIHDHNIINLDELELEVGDFIEIYKFFSLNTRVSFLSKSPASNISIAVLKNIISKHSD